MQADVLIIGAGVAGLAAARRLAAAGRKVVVVEARPRAGGRVHSVAVRGLGAPVEVGAEFIHGGDKALGSALRRAKVRTKPVPRTMWVRDERGLRYNGSYWREIARAAERIPGHSARSLAGELNRQRLAAAQRHRIRLFVEGFYAAGANAVSARSIHEDDAGASAPQRRPEGGYGPLIDTLLAEAREAGAVFRFAEAARSLRWRRGAVEVRTNRGRHLARAALITLPLGVWRAGGVRIRPTLPSKRDACARIGWGEVARITLRLRADWWRRGPLPSGLTRRGRPSFGFLTGRRADFPTWWVPSPAVPLMVGWCGGPAARRLIRLPTSRWRGRAVASLAGILGIPRAVLRRWVVGSWQHNWSADPFSRGGYSFPVVGREAAVNRLARPVAATLFFAGEATAVEAGTVHGAMESGERAAKEMIGAISGARTAPR